MLKIAILGRPNVGKSSLFNRLIKQNLAITSDLAGTTRDIKKSSFELSGEAVEVLDTGGIDTLKAEINATERAIFDKVREFALKTAKNADLILYLVDGRIAPQDDDKRLFHTLSKSAPALLVVNKVDSDKLKALAWEYKSFGAEPFFISVSHNRGISQLLSAMARALDIAPQIIDASGELDIDDFELIDEGVESSGKNADFKSESSAVSYDYDDFDDEDSSEFEESDQDSNADSNEESDQDSNEESTEESAQNFAAKLSALPQNQTIKVGIIGRVNVGKSSLLNALVGSERSVVSEISGTTIDPVDEKITHKNNEIIFIDTAGIRRAGKIEGIEKFALDRTNKALSGADIAVLVLDASAPFVELDEKISALAHKHALGVLIALNKWDAKCAEHKVIMAELKRRFRFLEFAPVLTLSAKNGRNIDALKDKILEVYRALSLRIPTGLLNKTLSEAFTRHKIPSDHGKFVRIYYATQHATNPPQITLVSNRPASIHFSYKRYLVNFLRERFGFMGTPIIITAKNRKGEEA